MKTVRPRNAKLPDIRVIRFLFRLLVKLEIKHSYFILCEMVPLFNEYGATVETKITYRKESILGLSDCKHYVEAKYSYSGPEAEPPIGYVGLRSKAADPI